MCAWLAQPRLQLSKQAARPPASQPGTTLARASEASKQATASQPDGQAGSKFLGRVEFARQV